MTLQYANRELPCPLCLLERVALFGICFGALANFRHGFGSAIFGIHMPVWSIIIAVTVLAAYAVKLVILGGDAFLRNADVNAFPQIKRGADAFGLYVIALAAVNLVSVVLQCGLGECHTFGYRLLGG